MLESIFQRKVIKKIREMMPGCVVVKNDPSYLQGIPDYFIFFDKKVAALEFKQFEDAEKQENQAYYIDLFKRWLEYASFVFPENEEQVLNEIQRAFRSPRSTRISIRK